MSWMAPLDAGFDLSICGFGQASGSPCAARSDRHESDAAPRAGGRLVTGVIF
jgi:hypothetical protein